MCPNTNIHREMLLWKFIRDGMTRDEAILKIETLPVLQNQMPFNCQICMVGDVKVAEGIVLKSCGHLFCRSCIVAYIRSCETANIPCPFADENQPCQMKMLPSEVEALVDADEYNKHFFTRLIQETEAATFNAFHCLTPNCTGFCIEEGASRPFFRCLVCCSSNCLKCKSIHGDMISCHDFNKQWNRSRQEQKKNEEINEKAIQSWLKAGTHMRCPKCSYVIEKNGGCQNMTCKKCSHKFVWGSGSPAPNSACTIV